MKIISSDILILVGIGIGGFIGYNLLLKKQKPDPQDEFDLEDTVRPVDVRTFPTAVTPAPKKPAAAGGGAVIWDSNVQGKWNNGQARRVQGKEGPQTPNGGGFYTAASGSPRFMIDGKGTGTLQADGGHGRIYIQATNYNARLSGELKFDTDSLDNTTWKLRNRHDQGGACENRFGGVGGHLERTSCGVKIEKCHNTHEKGTDKPLPKAIAVGQWVGFRFTVVDTPDRKGIRQTIDIDYKDGKGFVRCLDTTFQNPQAFYMDEATFMKDSNFWIRINNTKTASASYRNVKLTKVSPSPSTATTAITTRTSMLNEPYLYNGYYNRRRL